MNILFLANKVPWPLKDGGAIGTFSISYGLSLTGCELDMLAINTPKHKINIDDIPKHINDTINIEPVFVNTDIKISKLLSNLLFSNKPYIAERFNNNAFKNKLIEKLKSKKYDVVILEMLYMGSYIDTIREYSSAHITMRAPNIEHEIWNKIADNTSNPIKSLYLKNMTKRIFRMEKNLINKYDSLIPVSSTNAETYKKLGVKVPIILTTTGVFFDKINLTKEIPEENALSHIGALDWIPNIEGLDWFINNVWPIIQKEEPEMKFYIAGRNAPDNIQEKFNKNNIIYLGEVNDAFEFISSKSILVVPLLSGSGMRVKIIEGLALGRSIISTSTGAEGIDVLSGKHLEIHNNEKDFAKACIELYRNKSKRNALSCNGKKFIQQNYDNIKIAENLKTFYQNIL